MSENVDSGAVSAEGGNYAVPKWAIALVALLLVPTVIFLGSIAISVAELKVDMRHQQETLVELKAHIGDVASLREEIAELRMRVGFLENKPKNGT